MAGPSVMVRVLGDVTGLGKSFDDAGTKGQSAGSKMHAAFSGVLGQLNAAGVLGPFGAALAGADSALEAISGHAKEIGPVLMGAGAAVAGVGLALQAAGSKDAAAHQQLQAAVEATGHSYDQYADKVEAAVKHQENFGNTADQSQDALRVLTQATGDPTKALDLLNTATDLAAAKHESLDTAAGQLGKTYNGNARLAKEMGVQTKDASGKALDQTVIMDALSKKLSGQAAAAADTFGGKMDAVKAKIEDQIAVIGQKYGPAITAIGAGMTGLGATMQIASAAVDFFRDQQILSTVATYAWAAAMVVLDAVLDANPITLIILGIVALIAAIVLVIAHFTSFGAVWSAVSGAAVTAFYAVVGAAQAVFGWIANNWPLLLAILTGPFGLAVYFIINNWNTILGFMRGLPGQIAGIASGMWDGILHAFERVLNGVIDLWNKLHFTLPHIDLGPLGSIGGGTIGVPSIPHLAQGGLITASGLIYAHAGEAISPMPRGAGGPAIHIEHLNVAETIDIDAFMKRAAWAARTAVL